MQSWDLILDAVLATIVINKIYYLVWMILYEEFLRLAIKGSLSSPDCISYHFCLLYGILFCRMGGDRTCKSVKLRTSNCVCHSLVFSHPTFLPLSPFCIIVTSSILVYFLNLKKNLFLFPSSPLPPFFFSPMTTRGRKGGSLLYVIPLWLTVFLPPSS